MWGDITFIQKILLGSDKSQVHTAVHRTTVNKEQ